MVEDSSEAEISGVYICVYTKYLLSDLLSQFQSSKLRI